MSFVYNPRLFGLPTIDGLHSLADALCLSPGLVYKLSVVNEAFYKRFKLPRKSGGTRTILSPSRQMKAVQAWILRNILDKAAVHPAATAFRRGASTARNTFPHQHNRYFVRLDIEDFFPSIPYAKVYVVYRSLGYSEHVAHILSRLCTCGGRLPQGAVTSPALSNIVCARLDRRISGFVGRRNIAYTRYADDLTFSSMSPRILRASIPTVRHILQDEGFALNTTKTRYMGPRQRCRVTGLVISAGEVGVGRVQKRKLRAAIFRLLTQRHGADDAALDESSLRGWFAYLNSVDKKGLAQLEMYSRRLADKLGVPDCLTRQQRPSQL